MARRQKPLAECRADARGGRWAGIPVCVIQSPAYRALSVHARAVLVELAARMNGYNNGAIGVSQRELVEALGCSPRKVVQVIAELVEHGLVDVGLEGNWIAKLAREYRLTFVTTKGKPATNDYLRWPPSAEKSGATASEAVRALSATASEAGGAVTATAAEAELASSPRKIAIFGKATATASVPLIGKPYPGPKAGDGDPLVDPPVLTAAPVASIARLPVGGCEKCSKAVVGGGRGAPKRFCSERCRKAAENARRHERVRNSA